MFKQLIRDGYQAEVPDVWLTNGNPWEVKRGDIRFPIGFGGKVEAAAEGGGAAAGAAVWTPSERVMAVAYDNPIPGWRTPTVTNLRLWDAEPLSEFDLDAFNAGEYDAATAEKERAGAISAVLYPNDSTPEGKELRLKQQYFFVSASLQDVLSRFKARHGTDFKLLPERAAFQLNDTHPTIAVAELMRLLVDVEGLDWEEAWGITTKVRVCSAAAVAAVVCCCCFAVVAVVVGGGVLLVVVVDAPGPSSPPCDRPLSTRLASHPPPSPAAAAATPPHQQHATTTTTHVDSA